MQLALQQGFVKGRRFANVCAVCLYAACRQNETPHMLVDFADQLQVDACVLGAVYLRLLHQVMINMRVPAIDPAIYMQRFVSRLMLEDRTQPVANSALRIVARMNRDWMVTGRRPAGVCGAALMLACRMHECPRTLKEVVEVVRVCDKTVRHRIEEFLVTPSAGLTLEELHRIELEQEEDPPAFARRRSKEEQAPSESVVVWEEAETLAQRRELRELENDGVVEEEEEEEEVVVEEDARQEEEEELLSSLDEEEEGEYIVKNKHLIKYKEQMWERVYGPLMAEREAAKKRRLEKAEKDPTPAASKPLRHQRRKRTTVTPVVSKKRTVAEMVQEAAARKSSFDLAKLNKLFHNGWAESK